MNKVASFINTLSLEIAAIEQRPAWAKSMRGAGKGARHTRTTARLTSSPNNFINSHKLPPPFIE